MDNVSSVFHLVSSITDEAVERVCELLPHQCKPKYDSAFKCLEEMYSELLSANEFLTNNKIDSCQANTRLAVKHLFRSIQAEIRANEYLLESIRKMERANKATEVVEYPMIMKKFNNIRSLNSEV